MRGLGWVLGLLALVLGLEASLWSLEAGLSPRPLPPKAACHPGPLPTRAELYSNGVVELPLCRAATLELLLEGTLAQGVGPYALLAEGERVLWQGEVRGRVWVRVRVLGQGLLVLAFVNDLYQPPEDRNLFLRDLKVASP